LPVSLLTENGKFYLIAGDHEPLNKELADIVKRLDESGDANDQAGTEANFKKLQGILKTIEAQYPPETLKTSEGEKAQGYTYSMCGGSFDKPGKCPKCGMNLSPRS
jgi:hypothetical protein